jgi:stage II sporulation protein GA (sporulation sigma-E factor processing peptidase)
LTVYLDVIWALNLLFDSLLLYLSSIFLKRQTPIWRLVAGGFVGSLIILLSFTPLHSYTNHPISKLFFSVIMVLIAFGFKRLTFFIKALMTFYVTTFLIGGALIGAHYFVQFDSQMSANVMMASITGFGDPISWLFVVLGFPIAWHFSKKNIESMEMTKIQFDQIVNVTVNIAGETLSVKGLVDSGNQLYDPLSKLPVMFVSIKQLIEQVALPIQKAAIDPDGIISGNDELPIEWLNRLRIVPYRVVGQEHQLIVALKPDSIVIDSKGVRYLCKEGLVSFTMQQLSADDAFQCIVHPKMLTGQRQNGESEKVS